MCVCVRAGCEDSDVFEDLVVQEEEEPEEPEEQEQESGRFTVQLSAPGISTYRYTEASVCG